MTNSSNLALPYLEGAQAQKHVTVNESLRRLDALVLLAIEDKDLVAPPGSPSDGARYIPKATATGAWSGKENFVAHYVDGAWEFYAPREGFAAYVRDEDAFYTYDGSAWLRSDRAQHVDLSSTTTLDTSHMSRAVRVNALGGAVTITLPSSPSTDDWVTLRKTDSSANRVTVKSGATDMAWLSSQYDTVMFAYWGGAWTAVRWNIAPLTDVFTSAGTWAKPPLARAVEPVCIGAGGGGGSGRRGANGANRSGGQAGQGGVLNTWSFPASALSATESITIGSAGSGAAAQTANSSDGNAGTAGTSSSFGAHLVAPGGPGGAGGTATALAQANGVAALRGASSQAAAPTSTGGVGPAALASGTGTGGNGGSISNGNVGFDGTVGANGSSASGTPATGGAGGAAGTNNGSVGSAVSDTVNQFGGGGGGGGGANATGAGGNGATGGAPGGGGGGGGASFNGSNSGTGGAGARGEVRVTTSF